MNNRHGAISVLLADDHPVVLRGLAGFLRSQPHINVVSECCDGIAALKGIRKLAPAVAVLDMAMPRLSGLEILSALSASVHNTKFVLLTATASAEQIVAAIARGASGVVHKDAVLEDLVHCIREATKGREWLSETVADKISSYQSQLAKIKQLKEQLTRREQEIILLVSRGLSNKQVGHEAAVSEGTVKIHLHRIYQKIRVPNRTALTALVLACRDQLA